MSRIVCAGLGYVGLPLACRAAEVGHSVVGYEIDRNKVDALLEGNSYIEDVSPERIAAVLANNTFTPVCGDESALEGYEIGIITVPTPLKDKVPDLSYVEEAAKVLARSLSYGATIVLESTTYPGTTEEFVASVIYNESNMVAGTDYHLGFSPERIDPGNPTWRLENTPKLVSATTPEGLAKVQAFYETIVDKVVPVSTPKVAELSKVIENSFRYVNIAFVNEMAMLANELDIDVWEALDAASTKPFGFMKFSPGPGTGGHCLNPDSMYLSWRVRTALGKAFKFIDSAEEVNSHMPDYVVERSAKLLNEFRKPLNGSKILVLGLAYKAGTSDTRETPSERIIELFSEYGTQVFVSDPYVSKWKNYSVVESEALVSKASEFDLIVLVTAHDGIDYGKLAKEAKLILDCRHVVPNTGNVHYL